MKKQNFKKVFVTNITKDINHDMGFGIFLHLKESLVLRIVQIEKNNYNNLFLYHDYRLYN